MFLSAGRLVRFAIQGAAMLLALACVAQWTLPVWRLPCAYGALWLGAILFHALATRSGGLPVMSLIRQSGKAVSGASSQEKTGTWLSNCPRG